MSVVPTNVAVGTTVPTLTLAAGTTGGLAVASTINASLDYLMIYQNSSTSTLGINRNTLLGVSGQPADISSTQTLTNKTISTTNSITQLDGTFTLENTADATKKLNFGLGNLTTGTTSTLNVPAITTSDTIVGLAATQTLTNKTLTSPAINNPNITNATITADTYAGYTASTSGTIYGISIASGVITTTSALGSGIVSASSIAANAVTTAKLGLSTSYSGGVTSFSNSGTGGGTGYYINLGGIKMCWGLSANQNTDDGNASFTLTFPVSFFSSIQSATATAANMTNVTSQYASIVSVTTTTMTVNITGTSNSSTSAWGWFVIGT